MTKYRIRLSTGRVLGPFEKSQLFELKAKGHIKGNEEAQIFPTGSWEPIRMFDFYSDMMDENKTYVQSKEEKREDTFIIDLTKLRNTQNEKEIEKLEDQTQAPIEQLTETVRITSQAKSASEKKLEEPTPVLELNNDPLTIFKSMPDVPAPQAEDLNEEEERKKNNTRDDKTSINPVAQQELEKMRKLQREAEELKKNSEEERLREEQHSKELALAIAREVAPADPNESTQVIKLDKVGMLSAAKEAEYDIELELKQVQKKRAKEEAAQNSGEDNDEEQEDTTGKKKKKITIVLAAAALAYAFLFPEEKPKKPSFQHLEPQIIFPIPFDRADNKKSTIEYNRGLEFFNKATYPNIVKAGLAFKSSYENSLDNRSALNFMVRAYAEQLKHSSNKMADAQTLFNVIQSKRPFLVQDPNGVIGLNIFYMTINKPDAAIDVIQKYLKIFPKNVTQDLFAIYLKSLIKRGKLDLAKQFYQALLKAPDKNHYTLSALIDFHLLNQEAEKAMEYVDLGVKKYPLLPNFYLNKAELLLKLGKADDAIPFIKKAEALNLDYNNLNRAKYYELKGLVFSLKNKPKEATKFLTNSLKLNDSEELRVKLADLETSGGSFNEADKLINESKAIRYLIQARDFFEKRNYNLALSAASKASDAYPGHIPSELFLAKVQLKIGLAQQGLKTMESLVARYPDDKNINIALVESYIDTYKFNDAKNRIQIISNTDYRDTWEYSSVNAKLHLKLNDSLQAMSWLKSSISLNPLNDADIYSLAEILLRRANFDNARNLLNKCMELDPLNPDYRIAYARLIYETQDDLAAIGYLLSLKEEFGDNAKVMAEIAIFYYRSGKVKDFQDYKLKLEKLHSTDKSLYEFLIKAAILDDRFLDVPPLVEKLLEIEPGELEAMMTAGRTLFESGKLVEAAKWFVRVQEKLPSYPKVLYYIAKIDFLSNDIDEAKKKIERNIKENGETDDDLVFLAEIEVKKENIIEAENLYKRAQKINPKSYFAIIGLADLSTKRNNHDLALDLYKRAMKLKSDEALVHKKIGDVYRQLGQGALAIESYKMYLEMNPEAPEKSNLESYINLMQ